MSLCPEPSSPSSVYLPPLLDSSPYTAGTAATAFDNRQMCTYNNNNNDNNSSNNTTKEHVSCFSTTSTTSNVVSCHNNFNNNNGSFDLVSPSMNAMDPFARFQRNVGVSAFPSLRSLQDNLQLPFFFSTAAQPYHGGDNILSGWGLPEEQKVVDTGGVVNMGGLGSSELDCMWNY